MQHIVYLGSSLNLEVARQLCRADFRPPIRAGDLDAIAAKTLVAIIDGEFEQNQAITPREIHNALRRGVRIVGAASMGALRAVEVPGILGLGRIYEMYRDGTLTRDDEVALIFTPDNYLNLSVPLVNVRYSVERMVRSGSLDTRTGQQILRAAVEMDFRERSYPRILERAKLNKRDDAELLCQYLQRYDLKAEDARFLLEQLPSLPERAESTRRSALGRLGKSDFPQIKPIHAQVAIHNEPAGAPVTIWECGEKVDFAELLLLLKITGKWMRHAEAVIGRHADIAPKRGLRKLATVASLAAHKRHTWGWFDVEESRITLKDLGIGLADVEHYLEGEAALRNAAGKAAVASSDAFKVALRSQLWSDHAALKIEAMRVGSIHYLAALASDDAISEHERLAVQARICWLLNVWGWDRARVVLHELGADARMLDQLVDRLARARRAAQGHRPTSEQRGKAARFIVPRSPKNKGDPRFCMPFSLAQKHADRLAKLIGITRVGMIGELANMDVHIAQAYRPGGRFSTTVGGGKGLTAAAARIGSIMEEVEKYAQERFDDRAKIGFIATFAEAQKRGSAIDPTSLPLPYDSPYTPRTKLGWVECPDLISGHKVAVPLAALTCTRLENDPFFCPRLGSKVASTNGLASGFTRAEALTHALCELIERHDTKLAEIQLYYQNELGPARLPFVDLESLPKGLITLIEKITSKTGFSLRVVDIQSEIGVPGFYARLFDPPMGERPPGQPIRMCDGTAHHPNPEVAMAMAIIEAAQTHAANVSTSRDDLSIKSRSLGRHERPRMNPPATERYWLQPNPPTRPLAASGGFVAKDAAEDVRWLIARLRRAGYRHLFVADLSTSELQPAHVLRVVVPGLETTNPFFTGVRAREELLRDLLS